ncbi:hypothetical protein vseg_018480 [Gypsophila vaccaria]
MASTLLRHKSPLNLTLNPRKTLISPRFCSNSSDNNDNNNNNNNNNNNGGKNPPNFAAYFANMKPKLNPQSPPSSVASSVDEIRRNLSDFRSRTPPPPPPLSNSALNSRFSPASSKAGEMPLEKIQESLRKMRENSPQTVNAPFSLRNYRESFRTGPAATTGGKVGEGVIGGSLPMSMFGREKQGRESGGGVGGDGEEKYSLVKWYSHDELGRKLKELRPRAGAGAGVNDGGFSLSELRERLRKLREEEEERITASTKAGPTRIALQSALLNLQKDNRIQKAPKLDFLSEKTYPPKEHLIEKYFHPDNMSAAEKLKIKLKKVRDEFKLSESDCGSTRVQIAQLTTEIHHLSSVLHKKDKHSRRGLQAKVQQRKKLLKYLRRTDWDSYCFVLSKLGLRDNPDYKN